APPRFARRAEPAADITAHALRVTVERVAVSPAARAEIDPGVTGLEPRRVLGVHHLEPLAPGLLHAERHATVREVLAHAGAAQDEVAVNRARQSAEDTFRLHVARARATEHPLERAGRVVGDDHVLEADAAAIGAGARRLLALAAVDVEHRYQRLDALDVRDAVGRRDHVAAGVDAVAERPRAAAADRVREHVDERPPVWAPPTEHTHVDATVPEGHHLVAQVRPAAVHARHRLPDQVAGGLTRVHRGHAGAGREGGVVDGPRLRHERDAVLQGAVGPRQIEAEQREQHLEHAADQPTPGAVDRP